MKNIGTVKFGGEVLTVNQDIYGNGRPALVIVDADGMPYMTATVNCIDQDLNDGETIIKDYSENAGIFAALVAGGIVEFTGRTIKTGFVVCPVVTIIN